MSKDLELDIPEDVQRDMVGMYVNKIMTPETIEMYAKRLEADVDIKQALYDAVVNECVNIIMSAEEANVTAEESADVSEE